MTKQINYLRVSSAVVCMLVVGAAQAQTSMNMVDLSNVIKNITPSIINAQFSPTDWLFRTNRAATKLSFSGVFQYSHDGKTDTMQVVRRVKDDEVRERLFSLSGATREIVRDNKQIWYYSPDKSGDYRQMFEGAFPRMLPDDIERLKQNYKFTMGGTKRIANRMARRINVIPNDGYRYGYRLWADVETGLLLRSDLVDANEQMVEQQYLFISLDVDSAISDKELEAVTSKGELGWYSNDISQPGELTNSMSDSNWKLAQLPSGYQLTNYVRQTSQVDGKEVEHLIISDGLSTVSIFIKPASAAQNGEGMSRQGAVHAFRNTINDHRVTVLGEVPAKTVEFLASNVAYGG